MTIEALELSQARQRMTTKRDSAAWERRARDFQEQMGRVGPQPADVTSFTNRRFTVNFSAPLEQIQRLLPPEMQADPLPNHPGRGMLAMCACDFWVPRIGALPIYPIRNNDMLLRVSARFPKGGRKLRAFYTIRSESSSWVLGTLGRFFSHFRKCITRFDRVDDERVYSLRNQREGELSTGWLSAQKSSIVKAPPPSSLFASIDSATDYAFRLDGSCGFDWATRRISFQPIEYPEWDLSFCHAVDYQFPLLDTLAREFELELAFDSVLCMENTHQTWCKSTLFKNDAAPAPWYAR